MARRARLYARRPGLIQKRSLNVQRIAGTMRNTEPYRHREKPAAAEARRPGEDHCVLAAVVDVCPVRGSNWNAT